MKIALVQNSPLFGAKKDNLCQVMEQMSSISTDLFVLPELFATGYNFATGDEVTGMAEPFPLGESAQVIKSFCIQRKCAVIYGFAEEHRGKYYNSAAYLGPDMKEQLYRKIHLYDREKLFFEPGDLGFKAFETPWGRIGIMICFDWFFPESARTLTLKGAQLIAHPSNLVMPHCPNSMPVRCRENRVFAATANRVGSEDRGGVSLTFIGQSQLTVPSGEILHRASPDQTEIWCGEINLSQADDKHLNSNNHLLEDRKPAFYVQ